MSVKKNITLHRFYDISRICPLGLTGFDGKMRWYVSTRRLVGYLLKLSEQKINWQQ